ncbi:hypothetical protein RRG08_061582 [Elysia crispata]|uniref:Uncharacterized protein n=1 Tax=Elysia crispata TaxID=231223 RepID=A0AAE0YUK8_9GAST|nr:hypothetical protein RRG08_061582 [Elysia crispata]
MVFRSASTERSPLISTLQASQSSWVTLSNLSSELGSKRRKGSASGHKSQLAVVKKSPRPPKQNLNGGVSFIISGALDEPPMPEGEEEKKPSVRITLASQRSAEGMELEEVNRVMEGWLYKMIVGDNKVLVESKTQDM